MPEPSPAQDREQSALYIRSTWNALLTPPSNREVLELLGKLVFAKAALAGLDEKTMGQILPYLKACATSLASQVTPQASLSDADLAYFINAFWTSLTTPAWLRQDLIDLGVAVYYKTPLAKIDPATFERLLPKLTVIAASLRTLVAKRSASSQHSSPTAPPVATPPSPEPTTSDPPVQEEAKP